MIIRTEAVEVDQVGPVVMDQRIESWRTQRAHS